MTIDEAFASPEGKTHEFKRDLSSPKPLLKTLVAFANTAGGRLIVGVADDRQVLGVTNALDEEDRLCSLIEQWGSGVRRIFSEAQELGLPEPQIVELGGRVRIVVRLAEVVAVVQASDQVADAQHESRLESRLESNLAARVMIMLRESDAGKAQLAKWLGHKSVSGELHKQIKRLLALEFIEMTLPDIPNSRLQKYRFTASGHELFQNSMKKDNEPTAPN